MGRRSGGEGRETKRVSDCRTGGAGKGGVGQGGERQGRKGLEEEGKKGGVGAD